MENGQLKSIIECLLFVSAKPLTIKKIKEIVEEEDISIVKGKIAELQDDYNNRGCRRLPDSDTL